MIISLFHVHIKKGQLVFKSNQHEKLFKKFLEQWEDQDVFIEVKEKKNIRSDQQNRYYWLYLNIISDETGNRVEDLHNYFKGKFLTEKITEMYGDKVRVAKSTTRLTKGEFTEYLIDISTLTGVELPDTEAYFGYSYHK